MPFIKIMSDETELTDSDPRKGFELVQVAPSDQIQFHVRNGKRVLSIYDHKGDGREWFLTTNVYVMNDNGTTVARNCP